MDKIDKIKISFPVPIKLSDNRIREITKVIQRIITDNPQSGQTMWPSEFGNEILSMPMTKEDDENGVPIVFDDAVFHIGVSID